MKKNWISWLALALSITACVITWLRVEVYTTNDTFVGLMAGFMGACATILVGVQIYSSIDTRNTINELNKSFDQKILKSATLQDLLKTELERTKKELKIAQEERKKGQLISEAGIKVCYGISLYMQQPFTAFNSIFIALQKALESKDNDTIEYSLIHLGNITTIISTSVNNRNRLPIIDMELVKNIDFNYLSKYQAYPLISDKCKNIENEIKRCIGIIESTQ